MAEETNVKPEQKPEEKKPEQKEKVEVKAQPKEKEVIQRPTNCVKCNKRLQRKSWYYRENGYYCSKRCWKLATAVDKKKEKKES